MSELPNARSEEIMMRKALKAVRTAVSKAVALVQFRIATHFKPDLDELLGAELLAESGKYPGVEENPFVLVDAGLKLTASQVKEWMANGYIPVGIGGTTNPLDEHGRGDGLSASTMVARFLGRTEDPALMPILAYSLKADDKAEDQPFWWASIIKTLHAGGVHVETVRAMHQRWYRALYKQFAGELVFADSRMSLQRMAVIWLLTMYRRLDLIGTPFASFADAMEAIEVPSDDVDAVREIAMFIDETSSRGVYTFDLNGLIRAQQATNQMTDTDILKDIAVVFASKVFQQRKFIAACAEFTSRVSYIDGDSRVAVIRSDNDEMQKAARRMTDGRLQVLVQVRTSGHYQVFSDQRRDLRPILSRLRMREYRKVGGKDPISWAEFEKAGTHELVPAWYGFEKEGRIIHIFNSTLKTRNTKRTILTEREVVLCVRDGMRHVHRARGVKRDRFVPVAPRQASDVIADAVQPPSAE